jgi:hypothetical protein
MVPPPTLGIAGLPVETLEDIITWLDSPTDLLSLALVTRTFKNIIIPNHLHYRYIRCTTDDCPELWERLSSNKSHALNVRKLEIVACVGSDTMRPRPASKLVSHRRNLLLRMDKSSGLPGNWDTAETLLLSAFKNMRDLTSFYWNRLPPLLGSQYYPDVEGENFWTMLRSCVAGGAYNLS